MPLLVMISAGNQIQSQESCCFKVLTCMRILKKKTCFYVCGLSSGFEPDKVRKNVFTINHEKNFFADLSVVSFLFTVFHTGKRSSVGIN